MTDQERLISISVRHALKQPVQPGDEHKLIEGVEGTTVTFSMSLRAWLDLEESLKQKDFSE